jgi:hypothetical protein
MLRNAHAIHQVVDTWRDILDQGDTSLLEVVHRLFAQDTLDLEECQLAYNDFNCEKSEDFGHYLPVALTLHLVEAGDAVLESVSLSVDLGKVLHHVRGLVHQDVVL